MNIEERIKRGETVMVIAREDIRPSKAFRDTYRKGERYMAKPNIWPNPDHVRVDLPNGAFASWLFFLSDMDDFFMDIEQQREDRLNELGI